jgi:hypothetical protein
MLPELEPRAVRHHFIVPSIRGGNIGFLKWPDIRSFKHLLQLLDFIDYAFNVHPQQYSEPALNFALGVRHYILHSFPLCQNTRINERYGDVFANRSKGMGVS